MGLTVRYPNGMTVVFNRARYLDRQDNGFLILRASKTGGVIARIQPSAGVMVEFEEPCTVKQPQSATVSLSNRLATAQGAKEHLLIRITDTEAKLRQARKELRELRKPKKKALPKKR